MPCFSHKDIENTKQNQCLASRETRQMPRFSHEDIENTRQRQCLSHEDIENTRQRQCLSHEDIENTGQRLCLTSRDTMPCFSHTDIENTRQRQCLSHDDIENTKAKAVCLPELIWPDTRVRNVIRGTKQIPCLVEARVIVICVAHAGGMRQRCSRWESLLEECMSRDAHGCMRKHNSA